MKLKSFLKLSYCPDDEIIINQRKKTVYSGDIKSYFNLPSSRQPNETILNWNMYTENWDYPVIEIEIE